MDKAIWWIRRDLRLTDNQALSAALAHAPEVIPLFIVDPRLLQSRYVGDRRIAFLFSGLRSLANEIAARGGRLIVRHGEPAPTLSAFCTESGASAIYAERDYSPYAVARDAAVTAMAALPLVLTGGLAIRTPAQTLKEDGAPYTVFTPYRRRWLAHPPIQRSDILPAPHTLAASSTLASEAISEHPTSDGAAPFTPGEAEASHRLAAFVKGSDAPIFGYAQKRDRPDLDGTSHLSPYLRFGMISARQAALAAYEAIEQAADGAAQKGAEIWLSELIWRDFYLAILHHFPHVRRGSFRAEYDALQWSNDETLFAAWCAGQTGYPFVDAAMRQLAKSGWMHNRARMVVASFLVKDLLIDWRWGEQWFMQMLVDGDPAANNGGWQWTAGTGTDAAPYFRIFNPTTQAEKFDPEGVYVRRWVDELRSVPDQYIHQPWRMPRSEQLRAGCLLDQDYPLPIVDHAAARDRTLAIYQAVKAD